MIDPTTTYISVNDLLTVYLQTPDDNILSFISNVTGCSEDTLLEYADQMCANLKECSK